MSVLGNRGEDREPRPRGDPHPAAQGLNPLGHGAQAEAGTLATIHGRLAHCGDDAVIVDRDLPERRVVGDRHSGRVGPTVAGGVGQGLAHDGNDAARHRRWGLDVGGAVDAHGVDAAARTQQVEGGGQLLALVGQGVDGAAHGVQGLVEAGVKGREVGDDTRRVTMDDLKGLDLQQKAGEEMADAVVNLAGVVGG